MPKIMLNGVDYSASSSSTNAVTGVKGSAESSYRTGNVNITPSNIGLGNVSNVSTSNQTPTFTQATSRTNIVSGEKLSVLFGKLMKWYADLKTVAFSGSYSDLSNKPSIPAAVRVKGNAESSYRTGDVNITPENIGAAKSSIYGDSVVSMGRKEGSEVGKGSFAFGEAVEARTIYSHAEGSNTLASGSHSHAEGFGTIASGSDSHAEGERTTASGSYSHAEGGNTDASGSGSHAEGYKTTANGFCSHAEGSNTTASSGSHAEGGNTDASGGYSHAEGYGTHASGSNSHAEGFGTIASGSDSHAEGYKTTARNYASHASGKYNKSMQDGGLPDAQIGDVFVIGNGNSVTYTSNAFRVTYLGDIYGTKAFQSSGADYAEYIKPWADGNIYGEDRIGYFVTVKDGLLYKANEGDYIYGITSGNPSIVGNADEDYYWRYERDEFNRIVMEDAPEMKIKTKTIKVLIPKYETKIVDYIQPDDADWEPEYDEDGNPIPNAEYGEVEVLNENGEPVMEEVEQIELVTDEKTGEYIMEETGNIIPNARMKLAEGYDPALQNTYIERKYRKEWDYVGMLGVLPMRDDGTCIPGQFCKCSEGGIATFSGERGFDTYMVIERISENVVSVILK